MREQCREVDPMTIVLIRGDDGWRGLIEASHPNKMFCSASLVAKAFDGWSSSWWWRGGSKSRRGAESIWGLGWLGKGLG